MLGNYRLMVHTALGREPTRVRGLILWPEDLFTSLMLFSVMMHLNRIN